MTQVVMVVPSFFSYAPVIDICCFSLPRSTLPSTVNAIMTFLWRVNAPRLSMPVVQIGCRYMTWAWPIRAFYCPGQWLVLGWLIIRACPDHSIPKVLLELLDTEILFPAGFTKTIGYKPIVAKTTVLEKNLIKWINTEHIRARKKYKMSLDDSGH